MPDSRRSIGYSILLIAIMLSAGCKRSLPAGIVTTISGRIFDTVRQKPVPGFSVYILEMRSIVGGGGTAYSGIVDSAVSGPDGRYSTKFSTTGHGIGYSIASSPYNLSFFWGSSSSDLNVGSDNTFDVEGVTLSTLRARIQITGNPSPPMCVMAKIGFAYIFGTNNDTIVFMKAIPNNPNAIRFDYSTAVIPGTEYIQWDTIRLPGIQDTFNITIQVDPSTFSVFR